MGWEAWFTIATIVLMAFAMVRNWAGPDTLMLAGLTLLMTAGLFAGDGKLPSAQQAVMGYGNEGLITVAVLFVVSAGLQHTGAMNLVTEPILGRPATVLAAQARLMVPVAALSAFLNNTPIVAMFMPVVSEWCKKTGLSPSKLFIPLSYAAIMGGSCTLIGTATNLVVYANLPIEVQDQIGMFTISLVAVPVALVGITYILIASPKLLPDRRTAARDGDNARRYTVEMLVEPHSAIDGKSIEAAGLRHLPGLFLAEIDRQGERIVAVGPEQILRGRDRLIFAGVVESVVDLQRIRGLVPATDEVFKLSEPRPNRRLVEVVVSDSCPLVGKNIREGRFRTHYDAVVIAVHRNGQYINQKIGNIVLRQGDTLLLETHPGFVTIYRNSGHFFLVSAVSDFQPMRHERAPIALLILVLLVAAVTLKIMRPVNAALLASGLMVLARCCTPSEARNSIQWRVIMVIGSAIGIGEAMRMSGAAEALGGGIFYALEALGPHAVLGGICLLAMALASMIQPVATALLLLPIAMVAAGKLGANPMPFAIALMMIPAASFATPMAYQTNLMVYGPGSYRATDYLRIGLPLNLIVIVLVVVLGPMVWPFYP